MSKIDQPESGKPELIFSELRKDQRPESPEKKRQSPVCRQQEYEAAGTARYHKGEVQRFACRQWL